MAHWAPISVRAGSIGRVWFSSRETTDSPSPGPLPPFQGQATTHRRSRNKRRGTWSGGLAWKKIWKSVRAASMWSHPASPGAGGLTRAPPCSKGTFCAHSAQGRGRVERRGVVSGRLPAWQAWSGASKRRPGGRCLLVPWACRGLLRIWPGSASGPSVPPAPLGRGPTPRGPGAPTDQSVIDFGRIHALLLHLAVVFEDHVRPRQLAPVEACQLACAQRSACHLENWGPREPGAAPADWRLLKREWSTRGMRGRAPELHEAGSFKGGAAGTALRAPESQTQIAIRP